MSFTRKLSGSIFAACIVGCNHAGTPAGQPAGAEHVSFPRVWVFSAGISSYDEEKLKLQFAEADASAVDEFFAGQEGGRIPEDRRKLLRSAEASRSVLLGELSLMMKRTRKDDLVFVFLSMHAVRANNDQDFYLIARDTKLNNLLGTGVSGTDLRSAIKLAESNRIAIVLDTCHAGAFGFTGIKGVELGVDAKAMREILTAEGTGVLSSSGASEVSKEEPVLRHGLFTHYLLQGLRGAADGANGGKKDGLVTLRELYDYTYSHVSKDSGFKQHPEIKGADMLPLVTRAWPPAPDTVAGAGRAEGPGEASIAGVASMREPGKASGTWVGGHWGWNGDNWEWIRGQWRMRTTSFEVTNNILKPPGYVLFRTGTAQIDPVSDHALEVVVDYLDARADVTLLRIESHTDADGTAGGNQVLSEQRAMAIARWLVSRGVNCHRLVPVGFGATQPLASNNTPENKAINRRIAFVNVAVNGRVIVGDIVGGGGLAGDPCPPPG